MSEIEDSLEDFNEESDELRETVEEILEEQTGIEWTATNISDRDDIGRIDIQVEPTGATDALVDEFGDGVQFGGGLSLYIQNPD